MGAIEEALYHTALYQKKKVGVGTATANRKLRELLRTHNTLEGVYQSMMGGRPLGGPASISGLEKIAKQVQELPFTFELVTINDTAYPNQLRNIDAAPPVLYLRGEQQLLNRRGMAVVGTRELEDQQDIRDGRATVKRLVNAGYVIISGLASGCDTLAHKTAIAERGSTIAVLGRPLDKPYPQENKELHEEIGTKHLLVTQFPFGANTYPGHFAHRNIVTAGLSEGVVVIRSPDRSGTIHAMRFATQQNKPVYALPNNDGKGYEWLQKFKAKKFRI